MKRFKRPSPSLVISCLALFISLGAGAYASGLANNSVGSAQLKPNSVKQSETSKNSVGSGEIANSSVGSGEIATSAVDSGKLAPQSVSPDKLGIQPIARLTRTTNQPIQGLAGFIPVSWTAEVFDTAAMHDNVTDNTRLTAPVAGIYDVSARIAWEAHNDSGPRGILLIKNGDTGIVTETANPTSPDGPFAQDIAGAVSLEAGDYVEVRALQIHDFSDPVGPPPSMLNPLAIIVDGNVKPYFDLKYMAPAP